MKKTKTLLVVLGAAVLVVAGAFGAMGVLYQGISANTTSYFTRIDNDRVESITPHGGMNYRYTIWAYREDGTGSELELDTSRVLADKAFLRVETAPLRGVIRWEELQYEELPAAVQSHYEP